MLKRLRIRWGLLVVGSAVTALGIGQCIGDFLEDAFIFRVVN
jgi:hypothetical protein